MIGWDLILEFPGLWHALTPEIRKAAAICATALCMESVKNTAGQNRENIVNRLTICPCAGPALCVSFLLAAVCCGFAGLCYAEFAAMAPVSGSAYSYAYLAFGELIAFVIGWDLILEYALQAATVSAGWSGYFNKLLEGFGLHLPCRWTAPT